MTEELPSTDELSAPLNLSEDQERAYHAILTSKIGTTLRAVQDNVVSRHDEMMQIKQQIQEQAPFCTKRYESIPT